MYRSHKPRLRPRFFLFISQLNPVNQVTTITYDMCTKNCNLANQGSNFPQVVAADFFLKNQQCAGRNSGGST